MFAGEAYNVEMGRGEAYNVEMGISNQLFPQERSAAPSGDSKRKRNATTARRSRIDITQFCFEFLRQSSKVRPTCQVLHISHSTFYAFLRRPDFDKHLERAREKLTEALAKETAKRMVLERVDLDERLLRGLDNHKPHKVRGDQDYDNKLRLGYETLGIIQGPQPRIIAQAQAGAQAGATAFTAFEVYEPKWLRAKKAEWDKQLAEKHGLTPPEISHG